MALLVISCYPDCFFSDDKKYKDYVSKLRNNPKKDMKAADKSRLGGAHGTQSHSPIYE